MAKRRVATIALLVAVGVALFWGGRARLSGHGFGFGKGADNCRMTTLPAEAGVTPVRVDCDWQIEPARLHALLVDPGGHVKVFGSLTESTVLGRQGDATLVRQVQQAGGIAPRAVVVAWTVRDVPNGRRYEWRKAPDQSLAAGRGVEVARYEGFWEVTSAGGGSHVAYEVRYAAGGDVPAFLVRTFQPNAIRAAAGELRVAAEGTGTVAQRTP